MHLLQYSNNIAGIQVSALFFMRVIPFSRSLFQDSWCHDRSDPIFALQSFPTDYVARGADRGKEDQDLDSFKIWGQGKANIMLVGERRPFGRHCGRYSRGNCSGYLTKRMRANLGVETPTMSSPREYNVAPNENARLTLWCLDLNCFRPHTGHYLPSRN